MLTEDARSLDFVTEFGTYVRNAGFDITHIDSFVVLGTTRLRPHVDAMCTNLATALDIDPTRVSVKARSNDGIGAEDEGLAAAAWAAVLLAPGDWSGRRAVVLAERAAGRSCQVIAVTRLRGVRRRGTTLSV